MKGKLTKKRYRCATIFVNHFSRLRFIHLQTDDSSEETLAAKRAFKTFAAKHGVRIHNYHCDNGCFYNNAFKQACHDARQQLTLCGVNAHFQNGIAERSIRDLSESARKQRQYTSPYGHMLCATPLSSTTACQCWRTAHQGLSFSAQFELEAT